VFPLTFMSSTFGPVDSVPAALAWFADNQPVHVMVDAMCALWLDAAGRQQRLGCVPVDDRDPRALRLARDRPLSQDRDRALGPRAALLAS
jgi:hypothetical protein